MKRLFLIIACIIGIFTLGTAYYFIFNLEYGPGLDALVWGLPFPAAMVFLIYYIIYLIQKNNRGKFLSIVLLIANILGFLTLGTLYFYAFDLQWGITWQAVTWGLPLLAGMVFLVLDTIFMIKKQSWKIGLRGFGIGWAAFIYIGVLVWFFSSLFLVEPQNGPKETTNTIENKILTLLLTKEPEYRKYISWIDAKTQNSNIYNIYYDTKEYNSFYSKIEKNLLNSLIESREQDKLLIQSVNATLKKLLDINRESVSLTLKSSSKDGYFIDYDGKISRYFESGSGGWNRLRLFRRCISGNLEVSIPAYDSKTGIVIVYIGQQFDYLFGQGRIFVFMYENERLIYLADYEIWVS